ncbi:MAG: hypothetical protein M3015_17325 [Bacteroidota bacterium]|nr:hypothetical protein [Bacteroidota bacterium]
MNVELNRADSSFNDLSMEIDSLEKNTEAFPYSSYARYLLLLQYKKNGHSDFEKAAKKTALYFNNTQWLQLQLSQPENDARKSSHDSYSETNHFAVLTEEQIESENKSDNNPYREPEDFLAGNETPQDEALTVSENIIESENGNDVENAAGTDEIIFAEVLHGAEEQAIDTNINANINDEENFVVDAALAIIDTQSTDDEKTSQNTFEIIENTEVNDFEQRDTEITEQPAHPQQENYKEDEIIANAEPFIIPPIVTLENGPGSDDVIAFEPLHTVDYFASQGIKITDEAFTNDKLGTQMKSFTEWLRSMKKLHPGNLPQQSSLAENIIQSAAETSNIDTEVLTEAMAEVLIKQDKREKAIEMYNKLSLINPAKSAYFAAKIESIKSI